MAKCEKCGKGPQFGKNRPFSMKATNRRYNVNVQRVTIQDGGRPKRARLCTRCIRTLSKA